MLKSTKRTEPKPASSSNAASPGRKQAAAVASPTPAPRPVRRARLDVDSTPKPRAMQAAPSSNQPRGKAATTAVKRTSALHAAAQVLAGLPKAEAREGISAPELIERMKKAKLWTSPGGRTPAATLYAAMIREIAAKGKAARFTRIAPGRFAAPRKGGA